MAERTQSDLAYKELSHRILILEIPANTRIGEEFWSDKLQVNRSAIREALTRLLGERLVRQGERGGFFVNEMTEGQMRELAEVRGVLEIAAAELACDRASAKEIKALEETCDDFSAFVRKAYFTAAHEADLRFHQTLMAASGNESLRDLYERAHFSLLHRKLGRRRSTPEDFAAIEKEHAGIMDAIRRKDKKAAADRLRAHFQRALEAAF